MPISDYYDLSQPTTLSVRRFRIEGLRYTIRFRNMDQMVDLERILIGIFAEVRNVVVVYF